MTSILIADDHEVVRLGLRAILETRPNCEVVAEALDGKEAILKAIATKPDIAVLADTLPVVDGLEATRQIRASLPQTEVLVFAMHHNEMLIEELLRAGARGYVRKSDAKRRLLEAIEALAANRAYFSSAISQMLLDENPAKAPCHHRPSPRASVLWSSSLPKGIRTSRLAGFSTSVSRPWIRIVVTSMTSSISPRAPRSCDTPSATSSLSHE